MNRITNHCYRKSSGEICCWGYCELCLEKLGIEEVDAVVFLSKVLDYITEKITELGGTVRVGNYFYGNEKIEDLLLAK